MSGAVWWYRPERIVNAFFHQMFSEWKGFLEIQLADKVKGNAALLPSRLTPIFSYAAWNVGEIT